MKELIVCKPGFFSAHGLPRIPSHDSFHQVEDIFDAHKVKYMSYSRLSQRTMYVFQLGSSEVGSAHTTRKYSSFTSVVGSHIDERMA